MIRPLGGAGFLIAVFFYTFPVIKSTANRKFLDFLWLAWYLASMEEELLKYLHLIASLRSERFPTWKSYEAFVLCHGQFYTPGPRPSSIKKETNRQCFKNAADLVFRHPELTYVEGWGFNMIPIHHAWCVTSEGKVVDPTWKEPESCIYFGVAFPGNILTAILLQSEVYGVFYKVESRPLAETPDDPLWLDRLKAKLSPTTTA